MQFISCAAYDLKGLVQGPFSETRVAVQNLLTVPHESTNQLILDLWARNLLLKFEDHYISLLLLLQIVQLCKFIKRPKEFEHNTFGMHKDRN